MTSDAGAVRRARDEVQQIVDAMKVEQDKEADLAIKAGWAACVRTAEICREAVERQL